ncbi:MAG TPA: hypothetical protein VHZ98_03105 [Galbitalea sp.]|jgi:hypothetical protein|nr:hypothetical protein [Galbitalea sp.]
MFELGSASVIAAALRASRDELDLARRRVTGARHSAPDGYSSGWLGPAGWAYGHALALLDRDLDAAADLLRAASDLTSTALYQLGHGD